MAKIKEIEEKNEKIKYRRYKLVNAYNIENRAKKKEVSIKLEDIYDKYVVAYVKEDGIKEIKEAKMKDSSLEFEADKKGDYYVFGKDNNKKGFIILIAILLFLATVFGIAYSYSPYFRDMINEILKVETPSAPEIAKEHESWTKEELVKVTKDAKNYSGVAYYQYCVTDKEDFDNCKWQKTETKNAKISKNGKHYVVFRGVAKTKETGKISNTVEVLVDNENPVIEEVKIEETKIKVKTTDRLSGVESIYFRVDEKEYEKTGEEIDITKIDRTIDHKIEIKVEDKVGNIATVEMILQKLTNEEENSGEEIPDENGETPEEVESTKPEENKKEEEKIPTNKDEEAPKKLKAPIINLNKVPVTLNYGEEYELPSYYEFDEAGGEVECKIEDGSIVTNTKEIGYGNHTITCEARGNNGLTTKIKREITVNATGEDEVFDGWIRMNLYFPENSTDWQWRLGRENGIRTGLDNDGWQPYTGPILVKLSDVENVYIRYKLNGETITVPPKGRILVDIIPNSYSLRAGKTTKVRIVYDKNATVKEYRIGNGDWQEYTEEFEVGPNTLIEARAEKEEDVYDKYGEYITRRKVSGTDAVYIGKITDVPEEGTVAGGPDGSISTSPRQIPGGFVTSTGGGYYTSGGSGRPSTYLAGPIITSDPSNEIVETTKVKVTPQEVAYKTYISIDYGAWQEYTDEVDINKNCVIRAYYIRYVDGKKSDTSYYRVNNIKVDKMPYVRIDATPSRYLTDIVDEVEVTISGSDYNTLEYSLDDKIYYPYTEPLKITTSTYVYARGTNEVGTTVEKILITTPKVKAPQDELDVAIMLSPEDYEVQGLINKTKVEIEYDYRATKKYYKIGYYGTLMEYTEPFEMTANNTVYAYAVSENGYGETRKSIDYLTTGISAPKIVPTTTDPANSINVEIQYAKTASKKKYKIDNGPWMDYGGPITVDENCTIYAYNEDKLKNHNESSKTITNIVPTPRYTIIDKGSYFILKLNYPDTSKESTREYKWTPNGEWKHYEGDKGIVLIKSQYKDEVLRSDGVEVEDSKGEKIIFTDHYYFVSVEELMDLSENLYMRWDTRKPDTPEIIPSTKDPARKLTVGISYDPTSTKKLYKIITDTSATTWLEYEEPFEVTDSSTIIYAKSMNYAEVYSEVAVYKAKNIDDEDPTVDVVGDFVTPRRILTLKIVGRDNIKIDKVGYAKGSQDASYFEKGNGTFMKNNGTFKVDENGIYTVCAIDAVGNIVVKEIEVTNIDDEAPDVQINVLTEEFGTEAEVEIDYGDARTKQYKIGETGAYKNYTGNIIIKSNDVLNLANDDGTLTIYAKGIDAVGNITEVSEKIMVLDLDAPAAPIINASAGYPLLTEYGVTIQDTNSIVFDQTRDDIDNYYSTDNGETWKLYKGTFGANYGTIMAKSVKKISGLTLQSTATVKQPSTAIGAAAYDGSTSTGASIGTASAGKRIYLDDSVIGQKVTTILSLGYSQGTNIKFMDEAGNVVSSLGYGGGPKTITFTSVIPENASYIMYRDTDPFRGASQIMELYMNTTPIVNEEKYYSIITNYGFEDAYNNVTINYFSTAVQRLYRINEGEWREYIGQIRLEIGDKLEAKSIDINGTESMVALYNSTLISNGIGPEAYDGDENTGRNTGTSGVRILVDKSAWGAKLTSKISLAYKQQTSVIFMDKNDKAISSASSGWGPGTPSISREIPENTKYVLYRDSDGQRGASQVTEISLTGVPLSTYSLKPTESTEQKKEETKTEENKKTQTVANPQIEISYSDWSQIKVVSIEYAEGDYTNEYSLDNGTTWQEYTGDILVEEETTVLARSRKDGKTVSGSTFTITKIDVEEPEIKMLIDDRIQKGTKYENIVEVKYPKSAGMYECMIDDEEYIPIEQLEAGRYNITCIAMSGSGIENEITKEIEIYEEPEEQQKNEIEEESPPEETESEE